MRSKIGQLLMKKVLVFSTTPDFVTDFHVYQFPTTVDIYYITLINEIIKLDFVNPLYY